MKSHLQSYPCPLQINSFWNLGFLLGITIILQIITGIFLGLHYTSDLNSAYSSLFFFIREIFYGWCLRYLHSSGASFVFLFLFLHLGRAISYGSYFYNPNTWFSGIILFFFCLYLLQTHFGISSFSHPDNALEVCGLLTPLHIVPEWYFLCQYAMLKAVPNKNAGFIILLTSNSAVVYPRVNNFSILILSLSYLFLILSLISEFGGGTGWTLYPPLSTSFMSLSPSSTGNLIFGLLISGISSCLTSLNFWTTILNLRSYYLTLKTMPLFPWALLITGGMLLLTLPILSGALLMVLADLHSNTLFFDPIFGGDPIFYQHLFWFFGHPEVYILIIPAFGIISITISGILQKIIFGNQSMIFAMSCISLLGSVVWGHHMYTVGLETDTRAYFSGVTILISLPTGTKIFNWLSTYLGNPPLLQLKTNSPFFGLLFLLMFTIGGSTGIILGNAAVDLGLHDTYYVVAHFHFVLSLGAVIAIFSGVIFNGEKIVGSKNLLPSSSSRNSLYHLVSTFIGILLTFSPMHFLGFNVMPRRIPDFPDPKVNIFHVKSQSLIYSLGIRILSPFLGISVDGGLTTCPTFPQRFQEPEKLV